MKRSTSVQDLLSKRNGQKKKKSSFDLLGQGERLVKNAKPTEGATVEGATVVDEKPSVKVEAKTIEKKSIDSTIVKSSVKAEEKQVENVELESTVVVRQESDVDAEPTVVSKDLGQEIDLQETNNEQLVADKEFVHAELSEQTPEVAEVVSAAQTEVKQLQANGNLLDYYKSLIDKIGATQAIYFLCLKEKQNSAGLISLTRDEICSTLSIKEKAVRNLMKHLVDCGALELVSLYDPVKKTPNIYRLLLS